MEKTPTFSRSRQACRRGNNPSTECEEKYNNNTSCSTPVKDNTKMLTDFDNDDSLVHIACTQEGCEDVDVVWNWNSPQAKQCPRRMRKRLIAKQSPRITLQRHPSNNQLQNFEKLREELQSLKEAISVPDNEESLILSPLEEAEYKDISNIQNTSRKSLIQDEYIEDLFNDSADEQLVLFSQIIEADLNTAEQQKKLFPKHTLMNLETKDPITENTLNIKSMCELENAKNKQPAFNAVKNTNSEKFVPAVLQDIKVDPIKVTEINDQEYQDNINIVARSNKKFPRSGSENQCTTYRQPNAGKVEFHRTQSFEITMNLEHTKEILPQRKLDEIERNRREALARLESKRKLEYSDSPSKCTAEEIERKRLQALAKREAKRQQDIIERKRQEALKRLELNRKKNATIVKSSLSKRL